MSFKLTVIELSITPVSKKLNIESKKEMAYNSPW
jgi:hypothetical protein